MSPSPRPVLPSKEGGQASSRRGLPFLPQEPRLPVVAAYAGSDSAKDNNYSKVPEMRTFVRELSREWRGGPSRDRPQTHRRRSSNDSKALQLLLVQADLSPLGP